MSEGKQKPRYRIEYIDFEQLLFEVSIRRGTKFYNWMMSYRPESHTYQFITKL
jgi:hypothetical protein